MEWGEFFTIMVQFSIAAVVVFGLIFIGSAFIAAITDSIRKRNR